MLIDTHIHFWHYTAEEFGWIPESLASTRRTFLPEELLPTLGRHGVASVVAVQARQTLAETQWLLALAETYPWITGVVGWLPLESKAFQEEVERYARGPLVGLRHVVKAEPDGFLACPAIDAAIAALGARQLSFDLLVHARQLPEALSLVRRHEGVTFILDHLGNPESKLGRAGLDPWRRHLRDLAKHPNVFCKLSSGLCEDDPTWTAAGLGPYFDEALDAFGDSRILFGSNWPVVHALGGYECWIDAVRGWARRRLGNHADEKLTTAARRAYRR